MQASFLSSPLLPLAVTLAVYQIANWLFQRSGRHLLFNPVLLSVCALVALLTVTRTSYERYFQGAQFIHFLLGPAVVALAVPLYRHLDKVRLQPLAIFAGLGVGLLVAALSAAGIAWLLGAEAVSIISITPKSVTAPVAMGISQALGGIPSLTAVLVILTGMLGASVGPTLLNLLGVTDAAARGLAMGTASHGIGTARALQESETTGAFSGLAMGLAALSMALIMPLGWRMAASGHRQGDPVVRTVLQADQGTGSPAHPAPAAVPTNEQHLTDTAKDMTVSAVPIASLLSTQNRALKSEVSVLRERIRFLTEAKVTPAAPVIRPGAVAGPPPNTIKLTAVHVPPPRRVCDSVGADPDAQITLRFQRHQELLGAEHVHDLRRVLALAADCANALIIITGYTDNRGRDSTNERLSWRRAELAAEYLITHQIDPKRIAIAGRGPDNPIATNQSDEGRAKNRRVEVAVHFER